METRQGQFCNQQIAYLGMQFVKAVEPQTQTDKVKFI